MTAIEKILMDLEGKIWTRRNEMVDEIEDLGYAVVYITHEYISVIDTYISEDDPDYDIEYHVYIGHSKSKMWVEDVKEAV